MIWKFLSWFSGIPAQQLKCKHPPYARDYRLMLLREEEAWDAFEMCLNCGKEWHEKAGKKNGR